MLMASTTISHTTNETNAAPTAKPAPSFTPAQTEKSTEVRSGPNMSGTSRSCWVVGGAASVRSVVGREAAAYAEPHLGQNDAFAGRRVEQFRQRAVLIEGPSAFLMSSTSVGDELPRSFIVREGRMAPISPWQWPGTS